MWTTTTTRNNTTKDLSYLLSRHIASQKLSSKLMHSSDKLYLIFLAFSHLSAISSWCDKWYSCAYYEIRIYLCEHRKLPLANSNTFVCRKSQLHKKRAKMVRSPKPIVFSPTYLANKYMLSKSIAPDTPLEIWCILNKAQRRSLAGI